MSNPNRDRKGRFARKGKVLFVMLVLAGIAWAIFDNRFQAWAKEAVKPQTYAVATTTPPTRLERTAEYINKLAEERKKDESFIKETEKQIAELKKQRDIQAKIDALTIVRTQLETEIYKLEVKK